MFGWIARRIQRTALAQVREDLQVYIDSLKGLSADEMATALAISTFVRLRMERAGTMPRTIMAEGVADDATLAALATHLNRMIREAQKNKNFLIASGLMVWIHSVRAMLHPSARHLGQAMWEQLQRGENKYFEAVESLSAQGIEDMTLVSVEFGFVPILLRPHS